MLDANFWQDKNNSKNTIKEKKLYEDLINSHDDSIENLRDLNDLRDIISNGVSSQSLSKHSQSSLNGKIFDD